MRVFAVLFLNFLIIHGLHAIVKKVELDNECIRL